MDFDRLATIIRYTSRRMFRNGTVMIPNDDVAALDIKNRPFPEIFSAPKTKTPEVPRKPLCELCGKVRATIAS